MELIQSRLLDLMAQKKMSYQDLADITKIHKATLQRYFTGVTKKIPVERIWPIAFALDTTPAYLMGDTNDPSPSMMKDRSLAVVSSSQASTAPKFDMIHETFLKAQAKAQESTAFKNLVDQLLVLDDHQIKATTAYVRFLQKEADD